MVDSHAMSFRFMFWVPQISGCPAPLSAKMLRPPERPNCCWGEAPNLDGDDNDFVFAGLNYLFLRCRGKQKIWAADYPIVFHPHLCTNCSAMIGFKKTTLRQKAVYQLLTNPHYTCKTCKGYRPGYDRRFAKRKSARP